MKNITKQKLYTRHKQKLQAVIGKVFKRNPTFWSQVEEGEETEERRDEDKEEESNGRER